MTLLSDCKRTKTRGCARKPLTVAILRVARLNHSKEWDHDVAVAMMQSALIAELMSLGQDPDLTAFSDHPNTSHASLVALIDAAIETERNELA